MATKYLDKNGLSYFWGKLKAYVSYLLSFYPYRLTSLSDAGFDRWSYENARDDAEAGFDKYVKTGRYQVNYNASTKGAPSSETDDGLLAVDNFSSAAGSSTFSRLLQIFHNLNYQGVNNHIYIRGAHYENSQWNFHDWRELAFTDSSITGNAATATKLATARTINGVSFDGTSNITVADSTKLPLVGGTLTGVVVQKFTEYERGVSTTTYMRALIDVKDKNNVRFAQIETYVATDKSSKTCLFAYNTTATSGNSIGQLGIGCDASGNVYTIAPTPAVSDDSTNIATTEWVRDATGDFAFLSAYPYKLTIVSDTGFDRWSYNNIRDDTVSGFDQFVKTGRYHVNASPNTKSCPFTGRSSDGLLIVDNFSPAASSSSYSRLLQVYHEISSTASTYAIWIRGAYYANSQWNFREWQRLALSTDDIGGNAATATKLATAVAINGTNFDGSVAITTASWGTARNVYVADSDGTNTGAAISVDGSANTTLKLPATIKASITGNCSGSSGSCTGNAATATKLATARTINGVSFDGSADITVADSTKLPLTGGTLTDNLVIKNSDVTKGTAPSSTAERLIRFSDSADHKMGALSIAYYTDKSSRFALYAYNTSVASSESNIGYIAVGSNASGGVYTYAPNPASSSNDNSIATTKWVSDSCVKVSGDQTVAGTKTFSSTVLSTGIAGKDGDSGTCYLSGQPDSGKGAWIAVYGKTRAQIPGYVRIQARTENDGKTLQCKPNGDLTWNGNPIQTSSDERIKTRLESVSDDVLDGWAGVEWGQFKLLESVEAKGEKARHHVGLVAQQVGRAFSGSGADILDYGILCYEQDDLFDLWTVRYTEALCMEAAYMRRENARLKKRIADLEERLAALELKVS